MHWVDSFIFNVCVLDNHKHGSGGWMSYLLSSRVRFIHGLGLALKKRLRNDAGYGSGQILSVLTITKAIHC